MYRTPLLNDIPIQFIEAKYRLLAVRDPIQRLVSAYRNRVHKHRELSSDKAGKALASLGLDADPSLTQFVDQLEMYQQVVGSIFHHTRPMVDFVGNDASCFTLVCDIKDCDRLADFTNGLMGTSVKLGRHQTEGSGDSVSDLGSAQREKLLDYYREDYKAFGSILLTPA